MTRIRPLESSRHRGLRFESRRAGAERTLVQIGLSEIRLAAAEMPLCLAKDADTGRFNLVALMALGGPRNLFSTDGGFHATYMPQAVLLGAFRLDSNGAGGLAIDEGDPALGPTGAVLFAGDAPAVLLADVRAALERLVADVAAAQSLVDDYAERRLLRPLRLTLRYVDGQEHAIDGLYTLWEDALRELDDAAVIALHRADRLAPAAVLGASLAQIERLRQLHDAAHPRAIAAIAVAIEE